MKRVVCITLIALLTLASVASFAANAKPWRVGASWVKMTDNDADDHLGSGWGVNAEYSLGNLLPNKSFATDLSGVISYSRFDDDADLNYTTLGAKLRVGPGASPACDGVYGGVGLGMAFLDLGAGDDFHETNFQWSLLAGMNFSKSWYGEIAYSDPGDIQDVDFTNYSVTVGYRF